MFFIDGNDQQMYIPRCCKDKFFELMLPEELERTKTTTIYANSDFELSAIMLQLVRSRPLCPVTLVLPEAVSTRTAYFLHTWLMHKYSYNVMTQANEPHIPSLHLVTPDGKAECSLLRQLQVFQPYNKEDKRTARVTISAALFHQTIFIIGESLALFGSVRQEPSLTENIPNILTVTKDKKIIRELATMIRARTNNTHTYQYFD